MTFQAAETGTQAEMRALPEGQMPRRSGASHIKTIGVFYEPRIMMCRAYAHVHQLPLAYGNF
jgi:hypothetical protein